MALPRFYEETIPVGSASVPLNEDTARHVIQVLRMKTGDQLQLTDGKGNLFTAQIVLAGKKSAEVRILNSEFTTGSPERVSIAISLVKNASRFEWFLEKATEIGVNEIIPILCERTEKFHFRHDRMKNILISAMLQSQQQWLPLLQNPVPFSECISKPGFSKKYIAHCVAGQKQFPRPDAGNPGQAMVCVGPEGDFTNEEIEAALTAGFIPVTLGNTRLRTETAGIVAATLLKTIE
ncbi:MAG TPA: RsmE family RNA methyltransferase [Chitinophagaceae bacterium]|nr:RsmE family RNA methyltransferase [Chitinophagaceae bacterium]